MAELRLTSRLTVHDLTEFSEIARQAVAGASSISIDARAVSQIDALGLQAITALASLASLLERDCDVLIERSGAVDEALVQFGFRQRDDELPPAPYIYGGTAA